MFIVKFFHSKLIFVLFFRFVNYLFDIELTSRVDERNIFLTLTQSLFGFMYLTKRVSIKPQDFVNACTPSWFQFGHQQDSSEFLIYFLDNLNEQSKNFQKSFAMINPQMPVRPIESLFGCRLSTECICLNCNTKTTRNDLSFMTPLSFPQDAISTTATTNNDNSSSSSSLPLYSIQSLVDKYFQPEELNEEGNNMYSCNKCNSLQCARKTQKFLRSIPSNSRPNEHQLPDYIIFTLNRFQYETNRTTNETQHKKIMAKLEYNQIINLKTYNEETSECDRAINESYFLIAVVVHSGSSLHHGHYYSYVNELNEIDNGNNDIDTMFGDRPTDDHIRTTNVNWLLINDEQITRISNETFLNNLNVFKNDTPYVLFYKRLDTSSRSPTNKIDVKNKRLIDQITIDNSKYLKEVEERRLKRRTQTSNNKYNKFIKTNNNNDDGSNDDDEQPPSYCNNNSHIDNGPRFVF